jgi:hypothetical protein
MTDEQKIALLPASINGYERRVLNLREFVVIEYSKQECFIRHIHPVSDRFYEENLLFDVLASSVDEGVALMLDKIKAQLLVKNNYAEAV